MKRTIFASSRGASTSLSTNDRRRMVSLDREQRSAIAVIALSASLTSREGTSGVFRRDSPEARHRLSDVSSRLTIRSAVPPVPRKLFRRAPEVRPDLTEGSPRLLLCAVFISSLYRLFESRLGSSGGRCGWRPWFGDGHFLFNILIWPEDSQVPTVLIFTASSATVCFLDLGRDIFGMRCRIIGDDRSKPTRCGCRPRRASRSA